MSNVIFTDSFGTGLNLIGTSITPGKWDTQGTSGGMASPAIIAAAGRNGGNAMFLSGTNAGLQWIQKNVPTASFYVVGFAIKPTLGLSSTTSELIGFYDGGTAQVVVGITMDGHLVVYTKGVAISGNVLLGTASIPLSSGSFHYLECSVTISATVGTVDIWIDGVSALHLTGVNTKVSSTTNIGGVRIGAGQNFNAYPSYIADLYIANASRLGNISVLPVLPSGNGTYTDLSNVTTAWPSNTVVAIGTTILDSNSNLQRVTSVSGTGTTGSSAPTWNVTLGGTTTDHAGANQVVWTNLGSSAAYKLVNEANPDSAYSGISSTTVGDKSTFTYPAISASGTVKAVVVNLVGAGSGTIRGYCKSSSAEADSGADLSLSVQYADLQGVFETDPNTGVGWTVAGVNAAEFGVKVTA